jgi:hypothetical protein
MPAPEGEKGSEAFVFGLDWPYLTIWLLMVTLSLMQSAVSSAFRCSSDVLPRASYGTADAHAQ